MGVLIAVPAEASGLWQSSVASAAALPETGVNGEIRVALDSGVLYMWQSTDWVAITGAGGGDVIGAASSTANALARFSGTGGKTIKNSGITLSDAGYLTWATNVNVGNNSGRLTLNTDTVMECYSGGNLKLYVSHDDPQVSAIAADFIIEIGGGLFWDTHGLGDIGKSTYQDDILPAPRGPRDIYLKRNILWGDGSNASGMYYPSPGTSSIQHVFNDVVFKNLANTRYLEMLLTAADLIQTNCTVRLNATGSLGKLIFADVNGASNGPNASSLTLVSGVKTVANTSITANSIITLQLRTHSGTLGAAVKVVPNAGVGFTATSVNADGSTNTADNSTYTWFVIENG